MVAEAQLEGRPGLEGSAVELLGRAEDAKLREMPEEAEELLEDAADEGPYSEGGETAKPRCSAGIEEALAEVQSPAYDVLEAAEPSPEASGPPGEAAEVAQEATVPPEEAVEPSEEAPELTEEAAGPSEGTAGQTEAVGPSEEAVGLSEEAAEPLEEAEPMDEAELAEEAGETVGEIGETIEQVAVVEKALKEDTDEDDDDWIDSFSQEEFSSSDEGESLEEEDDDEEALREGLALAAAEEEAEAVPGQVAEQESTGTEQQNAEVEDAPESLEEKLDSFLQEEDLAALLASPPDGETAPMVVEEHVPPGLEALDDPYAQAEVAGESCAKTPELLPDTMDVLDDAVRAADEESDIEGQVEFVDPGPEASLADMASLALQLLAKHAALGGAAEPGAPGGVGQNGAADEDGGARAASRDRAEQGPDAEMKVMPNPVRWKLQRSIFRTLDKDGDGRLSRSELLAFARLAGFDGPDEDWAEEFEDLCAVHAGGDDGGPTLPNFRAMLDDLSDEGFHCTDKELAGLHEKLHQPPEGAGSQRPSALKPPRKPPGIAPELLTPGPRAAPSGPGPADAVPFLVDLEAGEGVAAVAAVEDLHSEPVEEDEEPASAVHGDGPEDIDVEDLFRQAWEEGKAAGEELGEDSDDEGLEGEEGEVSEVWGDADPHAERRRDPQAERRRDPQAERHRGPQADRRRDPAERPPPARPPPRPQRRRPPRSIPETEVETEVATETEASTGAPEHASEMATEVGTEMATEAMGARGAPAKRSKLLPIEEPVEDGVVRGAGKDVSELDDLLVQVGAGHLAEGSGSKRREKRPPPPQEGTAQQLDAERPERPAKSARRSALRTGGTSAGGPTTAAQAEALAELSQALVRLGDRDAMRDRHSIPKLASRILAAHLPVLGTAKVLHALAGAFNRHDVMRPHKLAILYVFHEMLLASADKSDFVADGARHFLELIGQSIAQLPVDKLGPFMKLLKMWSHVYTERYLKHLKSAWTRGSA